jgi:hypothetical protein
MRTFRRWKYRQVGGAYGLSVSKNGNAVGDARSRERWEIIDNADPFGFESGNMFKQASISLSESDEVGCPLR